jgi:DNA primase catalytic core
MPWRIPEADIERVKRDTDLVALVQSRGIELKRHGSKDWIGRCPFHNDQANPNFIVTPDKGLWHCMACGKAGNPIQFIQQHDGVSFRHAFELLSQNGTAAFTAQPAQKQSTVPKLPCPLDPQADDATLIGQVASYYHERLKQSAAARAYLASRGLDSEELIERFQLGFADRTLGLRLPQNNRKDGETLRTRLQQLGLWRESGHEHFNGTIVVPFYDEAGKIVSFYGRRVHTSVASRTNAPKHLYPPGPHRGLFNRQALEGPEIILCEAVLDAMTFYVNGFKNVTSLFGTEGFTDELWEAMKRVKCVRIAYDADDAGDRAAQRDAERFGKHGIEVYRIKFPLGMDANEYARKVQPADKSLALLINAATWLGRSKAGADCGPALAPPPEPVKAVAMIVDELTDKPLPIVDKESLETGVGWAPAPALPTPYAEVAAQSSSLVAAVSGSHTNAAKEEKAANDLAKSAPVPVTAPPAPSLHQRGEAWFLKIEEREYRVTGLEKTLGTDALKVTLRLHHGEHFHLDQLDLCRDQERRRFIERAAEETGLKADLLKRDLGRMLLAVEQAQAELLKPQEQISRVVTLSPEERQEAIAWLKEPNLIERLRGAFHQAGIIGEEVNTLVAYLAGVSRKLEQPLAIIIQSASAAGKTTLMDAVLSFFPEEERVKYSAMTGQSLYYLGETSLQHKILAVVEEAGAEKASYALKLLQSEGELTIASTGKDPATGKMVTQEYHVQGPVMIFLTTTAIDLDEELQNRCLTLAVDESAEQTERIHRVQRERRTLAGLIAREERKDLLRKLRNAQRLLQPMDVLNPYAPKLTFPTGRTRNRRDHEKYLTLIDAVALLHQHQRQHGQNVVNGRVVEFIEVSLDDIALANQLAPEVLGRSLDELPPQTRRLLGHIRELLKRRKDGSANGHQGKATTIFSRKELREACGWSLTQVRVHLDRLVELEYLAIRHGCLGSQFVYELLLDLDVPEAVAHVGLIDVEQLRHGYNSNLAGFSRGVAGQNGHLAGGGEVAPSGATHVAGVT